MTDNYLWLPLALLAAVACGDSGDRYNTLRGTRLLAIQAEPPGIAPGETAELRALVYQAEADPEALEYSWSWCPLVGTAAAGSPCLLSAAELGEFLDSNVSFDLGRDATASLDYVIPQQAVALWCAGGFGGGDQALIAAPDPCRDGFEIAIRLELRAGDKLITATKTVRLLLPGMPANANPTIDSVSRVRDDAPSQNAELMPEGMVSALNVDTDYRVLLTIASAASEEVVRRPSTSGPAPLQREQLFVTWFVSAGETKEIRTTYIDGQVPFENLSTTTWQLPPGVDLEDSHGRLIVVLRDDRGGVGWLAREVSFTDE